MGRIINLISIMVTVVTALCIIMCGQSWALIYSTEDFQLTGKVEAKAAFFTNNAAGNTLPQYKAWDMFKERNLAYLQVDHNLKALTGMDLQYHLVGRAMYEGVYDYGPKVFRQAYDDNKPAFDRYNLKSQAAIWEAYFNYRKGPVNIRIGRQNLSWGEMDAMRVIDHINPLDNTWGGTGTESLDDRRIPLWMVRVGYQKDPRFGIEGFVVPGAIDATVGPITPTGSPYASPVHRLDGLSALGMSPGFNNSLGYLTEPERDMKSSRVGLRVTTSAFLESNFSLSYQRTYWDSAALRFKTDGGIYGVDPIGVGAGNPGTLGVEFQCPKVNVFGFQGSHLFTSIDTILKGEVAHVQGAPAYITDINQPLIYYTIPGVGTLPILAYTGEFTYRDQTNIGISLEKNFWIRSINKTEQVNFIFEYYGNYLHNWDERIVAGGIPDPATNILPQIKRYEQIVDLMVSSPWYNKWYLSIATFYDLRGSWMFIPTLQYKFDCPLTIEAAYSASWGQWQSFGFNRDRDQVSLLVRYEF